MNDLNTQTNAGSISVHYHSHPCAHAQVKYCGQCNMVYCLSCSKTWSDNWYWNGTGQWWNNPNIVLCANGTNTISTGTGQTKADHTHDSDHGASTN